MIDKQTVSICIPTFNGAGHLENTLKSVVAQSYSNLEIIISDHGSTDSTESIVRNFIAQDSRIQLVKCEDKSSVASNWNYAIQHSKGNLVKLLCQDDILLKNCITQQVAALEQNSDAVFCFSPRDVITPKNRRILKSRGIKAKSGYVSLSDILSQLIKSGTNIVGEPCTTLIRRNALEAVGEFRGAYLIDLDMWIRLWEMGDGYFLNECLSQFRLSSESWTRALQGTQAREIAEYWNELRSKYPDQVSAKDISKGLKRSKLLEIGRAITNQLAQFF